MKYLITFLTLICLLFSHQNLQSENYNDINSSNIAIRFPEIIVQDIHQNIELQIIDPHLIKRYESAEIPVSINGKWQSHKVIQGLISIDYDFPTKETFQLSIGTFKHEQPIHPIPLWLSILPPLVAIFIALVLKEVYSALVSGIWIGTAIIYFYAGASFFSAIFRGFMAIIDTYIIQSLSDSGHLSIIIFSLLIAATVSIITQNGGMKGVVNRLSAIATGPRSGSFTTWLLGIAIFFDDYANTLVVGNTMRPLTDKLRISREKLAYIIDSTAAPVASIAFVTTWIGAELSYIQDGINDLQLDESAYGVFFNSLAYSFYPFFTLAFILFIIWKDVDFGPMHKAESKARAAMAPKSIDETETFEKVEHMQQIGKGKARSLNAIIPVLVIVFGTITGLLYTGWDQSVWDLESLGFFEKLSETIGKADSYSALLWASFSGLTVAAILSLAQGLLNLKQLSEGTIEGFRTMMPAIIILTLAWGVALVTKHMHTAEFISGFLMDASVSPYLIPTMTFIMAAFVSFSTGSSWGTMAILYPLMLPAGWLLCQQAGLDYDQSMAIFHNIAAAVLTGSVLGDHCSPISDTTILSSLASSCPHLEHVRTQLPYALTTGLFAIILGVLPASYGISPWILFPAGLAGLYLVIHFFGKPTSPADIKA